jgi:hypothetical protein
VEAVVPVVSLAVLQMAHVVPVATPEGSLGYWAGLLAALENRTIVSCRELAVGDFWVRAAERPGLVIVSFRVRGVEQQEPAFHLATVMARRSVARLQEREEEGKRGKKSPQSNDTSWPDPPFPAEDGAIRLLKIFIVKLLPGEKKRS